MKKIISLFLCLTICLAMFTFVGVFAEENIVFSESFEDENIKLTPWTKAGEALNSIVGENATDGKKALLINDDTDATSGGVSLPDIPVEAGATYIATADVSLIDGAVDFILRFFDENKKQVGNHAVKPKKGDKGTLTITAIAPKEAVVARVIIASYGATMGKAYYDNIVVKTTASPVKKPDADGVIFEETFEGDISTWTFHNDFSKENMTVKSENGSKVLYANDSSDATSPCLKSVSIPVTAGEEYKVSIDSKIESGDSMRVYVKFFDAGNKQIFNQSFAGGKAHDWKTNVFDALAPEGATALQLWVAGGNKNTGAGYFDNIKVITKASAKEETKLEKINKSSIVLFLGSANALVNGEKTLIDKTNNKVIADTVEGRTLVPVRFIAENYGAEVGWDDATQTVTLKMADKNVTIVLDKKEIDVNGEKITIDVPAQTIEGRTMLPLRAFVESVMGKTIFWDDRGLIVITDEAMLDATADKDTIDTIINNVK